MINTAYVNSSIVNESIEKLYMETVDEIHDIVSPLQIAQMQRNDMLELGIYEESADSYFEESVKDAVTKLGEKILEILNRIKEFIKNIPNAFKEAKFSKADVDKKADMIRKADPARYEQLQVYVEEGLLDLNSFESMKDYYKNVDDLIDELKKKDVNEKSLRGKLEKVKKGIEKNGDTIKTISIIVGIVGTGATLALTWRRFRNAGDDRLAREEQLQANAAQKRVQELERVQRMIDNPGANNIDMNANTRGYVTAQLAAELERTTKINISAVTRLRLAIWRRFDATIGRIHNTNNGGAGLRDNVNNELNRMQQVSEFHRSNYNTQVENVLRQRH
jgi:hypothetical protein